MEKNTVTIEIKQEVSITLVWTVVGVIVVSLAFFLASGSTDLWPATNAAGIATAIYLIALFIYALRNPISTKLKLWIGISAIVVLGFGTFDWMRMQEHGKWQAATMMRIRGVIGRGVMVYYMFPEVLKTLGEFHHPVSNEEVTMAEVFSRRHPGISVGSNIHKPEWEGDSVKIIVSKLEPGRIELLSQETFVKGRDPRFRNYNGQYGMIQEKVILTEKGVTYVSEN